MFIGVTPPAGAQSLDATQLFEQRCATCHLASQDGLASQSGAAPSRAPALEALRARTPQAIVEALVTGSMRVQGSRLSGPERRALAEYITGKPLGGDVRGAETGRCAPGSLDKTAPLPGWSGWSPAYTNTRFQPHDSARLGADDLKRLTLKWSFGFPDASVAWSQPALALGRLFVGSQNGTVYSLDAKSGCIHWTVSASGGVRTAISVANRVAYFGDTSAQAYAVNADTGVVVWSRKVDDHPLARITGSPALFEGRLYVPVSSYEESQGADPQYPCCTFRGSVVALEASTGKVAWKTHTIASEPQRRGTSSTGTPLWGPAGGAV